VTALREEDLTGALAQQRRVDELLRGLDAALDRVAVLGNAVVTLANALSQLLEPEDLARLGELIEELRAPDEDLSRVREAAGRSKSLGADALGEFIQQRQQSKKGEWIPPRGTARRPGDKRIPAGRNVVAVDPDGRVWGNSPDIAPSPLDQY
jgi:hypothetical protein